MTSVRLAAETDLEAIVSLTSAYRRRLAGWSARWWRMSADADRDHPGWLAHMLTKPEYVVRVADDDGTIAGCAVSVPQRAQWFIDDVAVADDGRWATTGVVLLHGVTERPALTCVPSAHEARHSASIGAGLRPVSSYWIGAPRESRSIAQNLDDRPIPASSR